MPYNKENFNEEDFKKLLDALSEDLLNAGHHFRLFRKLDESMEKYDREIKQCPAFWELTLTAHLEVSLLYLCRAYDNHNKDGQALSLKKLINLIRKNTDLFQISNLQTRFKTHDFPDILVPVLNEQLK